MKILKRVLLIVFLLWLIPTVITAILVPLFHKAIPAPKAVGIHKDAEYVRIVDDNGEAMLRRLQIIQSAKEDLVLSTYYFADDDAGRDVMAALLAASQRGVHVRILIDGLCDFTSSIGASPYFQTLLAQENVEARVYNPIHLLFPFNENYRMHDKYLIADQQVYILGGRNTRNKSIGSYPGKQDADRDALVYCSGPDSSVSQLYQYFEAVWNGKDCDPIRENKKDLPMEKELLSRYDALLDSASEPIENCDFLEFTTKVNNVSLFVNPVGAENKVPQLWVDLLNLMGQGKDIEVQTPYMILSTKMHRQFSELNQGRDMKIITNAPETGANPMGCAELLNRKKHLLKTGFELFEYAADRSSHVKTVVIDDHLSLVGSFNFDMRSAYLDTETMLLIDSPEINASLRETNNKYKATSRSSSLTKTDVPGPHFRSPEMTLGQKIFYSILRVLIVPLRQLL